MGELLSFPTGMSAFHRLGVCFPASRLIWSNSCKNGKTAQPLVNCKNICNYGWCVLLFLELQMSNEASRWTCVLPLREWEAK